MYLRKYKQYNAHFWNVQLAPAAICCGSNDMKCTSDSSTGMYMSEIMFFGMVCTSVDMLSDHLYGRCLF